MLDLQLLQIRTCRLSQCQPCLLFVVRGVKHLSIQGHILILVTRREYSPMLESANCIAELLLRVLLFRL